MQVWPAIDIRAGKCVRLLQGDYDRETVYGDDPAAMARHWAEHGAQRLHLVDLDGARSGQLVNRAAIGEIVASGIPCQLGGGVRDQAAIDQLLDLGLARLVVGTRAMNDPDWFAQMCRQYPGRLALGLDARDGQLAAEGWTVARALQPLELVRRLGAAPMAAIIYTDIARDGMMQGPNFEGLAELLPAARVDVIASGGVTAVDQIQQLAELGVAGCIVGKAMYEGALTLEAAMAAAGDQSDIAAAE